MTRALALLTATACLVATSTLVAQTCGSSGNDLANSGPCLSSTGAPASHTAEPAGSFPKPGNVFKIAVTGPPLGAYVPVIGAPGTPLPLSLIGGPPGCEIKIDVSLFATLGTGVLDLAGTATVDIPIPGRVGSCLPFWSEVWIADLRLPSTVAVITTERDVHWTPASPRHSIYDIQRGLIPEGTPVDVRDVHVTGVSAYGPWVQHATGGAYSGIYVFLGSGHGFSLAEGDRVNVTGTYVEYAGLSQIDASAGNVAHSGTPLSISPQPVSASELGRATAEKWEGVLVAVQDVTVSDPDLGYGEWEVTDGTSPVRIDDMVHTYSGWATLAIGDPFVLIVGPLHYTFGAYKMEPRSEADFVKP